MNNYQFSNDGNRCVMVVGRDVYINGEKLPTCPAPGNSVTNIDGKVYIDGYEFDFKKYRWKKTLRAFWHRIF